MSNSGINGGAIKTLNDVREHCQYIEALAYRDMEGVNVYVTEEFSKLAHCIDIITNELQTIKEGL